MSLTPIASYAFLSWARQGLGAHVKDAPAGSLRGTIPVGIVIGGARTDGAGRITETVSRDVALYGPGDIIGIDARAIVRSEPRHWITNFENNYLAFVEFYDEDFPWRYTPTAPSPDRKRLTPWIALVVLEEDEFEEAGDVRNRPLAYIRAPNAQAKFPPAQQLWAWAHVHINGGVSGVNVDDTGALAARLQQTLQDDRDKAYSRLLCPRALKPNTGYHAFVMPAFESGRLAGLGLDPSAAGSATKVAWDGPGAEPEHFPVYHRWYFRTGAVGDFEYLVRLLQAKPADPRVGQRDMDVQAPGAGIDGIADAVLGGVLRLGGALRVPRETLSEEKKAEFVTFDEWAKPFPRPFQTELAQFANLPTDYAASGAPDDPLIAPPMYGRWHAKVTRLLDGPSSPGADREKWMNELNLDPRYRVAAGFGTRVVQKNQEDYMEAAWRQVGDVLAGNQKIRFGMMALAATQVWNVKHFAPLRAAAPERFLMLAAPVQRRVLAEGLTIHYRVRESMLPTAALSKTMRQALRPRARIARRARFDATRSPATLLGRINRGEVTAAPPKTIPPLLPTPEKLVRGMRPPGLPGFLLEAIGRRPWLAFLPLLIAAIVLLALLLTGGPVLVGFGLAAAGAAFAWYAEHAAARDKVAQALLAANQTPEAVDRLRTSPDFTIAAPGTRGAPARGRTDSEEARKFKTALRSAGRIKAAETAVPMRVRAPLELGGLAARAEQALKPERTIPAWTMLHVAIPKRIRERQVEAFGEVMVYPEIDVPMYEPLKDVSAELFLPNIQLIEPNSITLLETNQKFIEAYMVGLNHEFARELLWREYPTDQRGSYFRQFWDVRSYLGQPGVDPEALRERLRDIPPLHTWKPGEKLDDHDQRELQGDKEEEVALVIRGELLKKYPTAVIYAHRAAWQRKGDGSIDKGEPRELADLQPAQETDRAFVKTPLYEAKVDPDIYFFGFDLTAKTAKGGFVPEGGSEEDPGWFFVIKERPGEPRFGLDLPKPAPQPVVHVWNELAWSDVMVPYAPGASLPVGQRQVVLADPGAGADSQAQYNEDKRFRWRADTNAAELAYILYQTPVLMAVHAAEMLPKDA